MSRRCYLAIEFDLPSGIREQPQRHLHRFARIHLHFLFLGSPFFYLEVCLRRVVLRSCSRQNLYSRPFFGQMGRKITLVLGASGKVFGGSQEPRSEEHTSELQSRVDLVCRLLLEKKNG